jgi:hypothetical protein
MNAPDAARELVARTTAACDVPTLLEDLAVAAEIAGILTAVVGEPAPTGRRAA